MKKLLSLLLCLVLLCAALPASALTYEELLQKAEEYIAAEEYGKAAACYDMAIKNDPGKPEAFIAEGNLYLLTGQYAEALAGAESALALDSTLPEGWLLRCRLDIARGDTAAFEEDALYAEICGTDLTPYTADIAEMYAAAGQNDTALTYFTGLPVESLDEHMKQTYARVLFATGNRDRTAELGLPGDLRNEKLDAAFEADALKLVETDLAICHPEVSDFELTEGLLKFIEENGGTEDPEAALAAGLPEASVQLYSLSPAGNSAVFVIGGDAVALYNGKFHVLYPAYGKGVEDIYGNLKRYTERYISRMFVDLVGEEGIVWSPDGRYAAIYNVKLSVYRTQFNMDPVIIDLATGEMILTATYPNALREENAGAVTSACFSADNRYFYYTVYGVFGGNRIRMCRYDLESGATETMLETETYAWRPHLSRTAGGDFLVVIDSTKETGLARIRNREGGWTLDKMIPAADFNLFKITDLRYSENSGYAVLTGGLNTGYCYAFQLLKADEDCSGFDRYLSLMKGTGEIVATTAEEYEQTIRDHIRAPGEDENQIVHMDRDFPYLLINNVILSPDGHYALVNTSTQIAEENSKNLFLVRLDDLAVRKVSGLDAATILVGPMAGPYQIMIEWNTDDLIIGTSDGIKTFRFDD